MLGVLGISRHFRAIMNKSDPPKCDKNMKDSLDNNFISMQYKPKLDKYCGAPVRYTSLGYHKILLHRIKRVVSSPAIC